LALAFPAMGHLLRPPNPPEAGTVGQTMTMLTNLDAESQVLGALILDPSLIQEVRELLPDELYFSMVENQLVYKAVLDLSKKKPDWDLSVLNTHLKNAGHLTAAGGTEYLIKLGETVATPANAAYHARIVAESYTRRQLDSIADRLKLGAATEQDLPVFLNETQRDLRQLTEETESEQKIINIADDIETFELTDRSDCISTGLKRLDDFLQGFGSGRLYIIAARPKMGKSALLTELALRIALDHKPIAFFSLEMNARELKTRMLCNRAGVPIHNAQKTFLANHQWEKIADARRELKKMKFYLDCSGNLTPGRLSGKIYMLKQKYGIRAAFVDYLQLMKPDQKHRTRYEDVSEISRELKLISMKHELPVVCASQLNRAAESREDRKPHLSDLRDSGSIEQDADAVILLHRPGYYSGQWEDKTCETFIAANRTGHTGMIHLDYYGEYTHFSEPPAGELPEEPLYEGKNQ
jgi:replicative DNA helicase